MTKSEKLLEAKMKAVMQEYSRKHENEKKYSPPDIDLTKTIKEPKQILAVDNEALDKLLR